MAAATMMQMPSDMAATTMPERLVLLFDNFFPQVVGRELVKNDESSARKSARPSAQTPASPAKRPV
jgi:hypothetical protein